jgi:hypothetical protein
LDKQLQLTRYWYFGEVVRHVMCVKPGQQRLPFATTFNAEGSMIDARRCLAGRPPWRGVDQMDNCASLGI